MVGVEFHVWRMGSNAQFWYASFSLVHDRPKTLKNDMITNSQLLDKSKSVYIYFILILFIASLLRIINKISTTNTFYPRQSVSR